MSTYLKNVPEVIAALGGNTAVGNLLGVTQNAVSNWRSRGAFPAHTYVAMQMLLARRGFDAPDKLWAMTQIKLPTARSKHG